MPPEQARACQAVCHATYFDDAAGDAAAFQVDDAWRSAWPAAARCASAAWVGGCRPAVRTDLIRCIFGNPFRPIAFAPKWRTDTTTAIAAEMYESRDFGAMPILADALQDAGCDNHDILAHCRDRHTEHVRACWVVDLVLGKA